MRKNRLPDVAVANIAGFGLLIRSGLTDRKLHVVEDAFTPGRNLLFLLMGAAYGYERGSNAVAIGLLSEKTSLFPDQTGISSLAQSLCFLSAWNQIKVLTPLRDFTKHDVVRLATIES